jgi:DNA-binding MarR family transcriptional regulator
MPEGMKRYPLFLMMHLVSELTRRSDGSSLSEEPDPIRVLSMQMLHGAILYSLLEFGASSQRELSFRLGVNPSEMVGLIDSLEDEGWVQRVRDDIDRRKNDLVITELGRNVIKEREAQLDKPTKEFFGALSAEELEQLSSLLMRVVEDRRSKRQS